ncbi:hypothetical protein CYMTET_31010 [Cymbomonas tetramitiformis]|uniref:Uncharacterized protein n=1 Tax=Cymbomonas tetramitiformis TaxID=36881 RepID=A0AAE0FHP7_9CHLO|nr:hypothetical protein CYMTET_31010 [Cymbomonas tetramitiformis]
MSMEQRLVCENRAVDWTPTAATRKAQLWEILDPVLYAAVKYPWNRSAVVGVPGDEKTDRDDILDKLLARLDNIKAFMKSQRMGGAPAVMPKRHRKGLDGFRVGVGHDSKVGFDREARRDLPRCPRCPTAGDGRKFHAWAECPLGGKRQPAGSAAAYCQPVEDCTQEVLIRIRILKMYGSVGDRWGWSPDNLEVRDF